MTSRWDAINAIYQIYPRSFLDGNGDGTGDIAGIVKNLDYLKGDGTSLGVDAIWLSPFYPSPMADFGYDISDYFSVDHLFGTMDDFKRLVQGAHERDIKVMVDYVPNHTSDKHSWFVQSRSSRDNERSDWYIWRDPKPDGSAPNNWLSIFGGSSWEYDEIRGQYYMHSFLKEQPDLNWDNPEVRRAMKNVLRFWMEHGVDGIRADAIWVLAKDSQFRDNPLNPDYIEGEHDPYHQFLHDHDMYGDKLFLHLKEMADVVAEFPDRIILFEDYTTDPTSWANIHSRFYEVNPDVAAPFNFEGIHAPYDSEYYRDFISRFPRELGDTLRPFYTFGNHDNSRLRSRLGDAQSRLIAMIQLTLAGIPVVYYGDEIGMKDGDITPDLVKDPFELRVPGLGLGRDPARTPMQWSADKHAGFSTAEPWLPISKDYKTTNVASESVDPNSYFHLYRLLLKLRRRRIFRVGKYSQWEGAHGPVIGYIREHKFEKMLIIANMSDQPQEIQVAAKGDILASTHPIKERRLRGGMTLAPHQGVVIQYFLIQ
ncbi:MAG TPA: alpha-amylase family glycosyl hydrolase [Candidatus Saccharimonadales bacterium]